MSEGIGKITEDISAISDWTKRNKLTLNINKTQAIILGSSRYINGIDFEAIPRIEIDRVVIQYSNYVKYLGVTIMRNLSWDRQIMNVTNKIRSVLY